jgi:hypothetical protein
MSALNRPPSAPGEIIRLAAKSCPAGVARRHSRPCCAVANVTASIFINRHESCGRGWAPDANIRIPFPREPPTVPLTPESMLSQPRPDETPEEADLRGRIFTDLDRLAFAIEMEAAQLLDEGREAESLRRQEQRLGVRLAQRLVTGVWADEVNHPFIKWADEYDARLGMATSPGD